MKTTPAILAALRAKLAVLAAGGDDAPERVPDAFDDACREVVRRLLARSDGNELSREWLRRILRDGIIGLAPTLSASRSSLAACGLTLHLAQALRPMRDPLSWVTAADDLSRRERAVTAVVVAALGENGGPDRLSNVIASIAECGMWISGQDRAFALPLMPERALVAAAINTHDDPGACFRSTWRELARLRDRARHGARFPSGRATDATMVVIAWFSFALDGLPVESAAHVSLWRALLNATQQCALAQVAPDAQLAWRLRQAHLAAHLARRLIGCPDEEASADLRRLLAPLLCLEPTLAWVVVVLLDGGARPEAIAALVTPGLFGRLLRRLADDQAEMETRLGSSPPGPSSGRTREAAEQLDRAAADGYQDSAVDFPGEWSAVPR